MTDEQIIKALRCWTGKTVKDEECAECSFGEDCTLGEIVDAAEKRINGLATENAALRERLEKAVELPVKGCLRILHNIGGCDATDDFSRGWDEGINTAFNEISKKYDVSVEEVFDDECSIAELKGEMI